MLPVNLLNALKEYAVASQKTPLPPAAAADAAVKTGPQLEVGQKVQGLVQTLVASNVFKVSVMGQLVQMELPPTVQSGDSVALKVISLQPRLTFSMVNTEKPTTSPEQLGVTARMLSSFSQQAPEKASVRAPQSTPLWETQQPPETAQLAGTLQKALSNSGLFYESHQAQWLGGERTTAQLMQEPQNLTHEQARAVTMGSPENKLTALNMAASIVSNGNVNEKSGATESEKSGATEKTVVTDNTAGSNTHSATEKAISQDDAVNKIKTTNENANASIEIKNTTHTASAAQINTSSTPEGRSLGIPDHLQPLVQQQLNALETNQMMWQGNIWPGQEMQWEVHEHASRNPAEEGARQWVTQIQLDLPNLGAVEATLRLNSAGLSLSLNASTPGTRTILGSASSKLASALSDAGISVLSTQVTNES